MRHVWFYISSALACACMFMAGLEMRYLTPATSVSKEHKEVPREIVTPDPGVLTDVDSISNETMRDASFSVLQEYLTGCGVLVTPAEAPRCLLEVSKLRVWVSHLKKGRVADCYTYWLDYYQSKSESELRIPDAVRSIPKPDFKP